MSSYRGLTWDHPRGRTALRAAAADLGDGADPRTSFSLEWAVQPLEGFESSSIAENARNFDLIVLDHPHLGDAAAEDCLWPLDALFSRAELQQFADSSVGPSLRSYSYDGVLLALPLDAATQVSARRRDIVPSAPRTWADVVALSHTAPVALSLAGPHAFLTFCSIAVALGEEPATRPGAPLLSHAMGFRVLELMIDLGSRAPIGTELLNPIALLELMATSTAVAYCPLVYGYANYSHAVAFGNAPTGDGAGSKRHGSTIGGTGIAISRRCAVSPALLDHVRLLMSPEFQTGYIPEHEGQPSARKAWLDAGVNSGSNGFYLDTLATMEDSWVRPRFAGFVPIQSRASAIIRQAVLGVLDARGALDAIDSLFGDAAEPINTGRAAS